MGDLELATIAMNDLGDSKMSPRDWILAIVFFFLSTSVAHAQNSGVSCSSIAGGGEADVLISRVLPLDNGKILIDIVGHETESATMNCSLWQDRYITLNPDHPRLQENFATILTAIATGSTLTLRIVEGSNDCSLSYAALHT